MREEVHVAAESRSNSHANDVVNVVVRIKGCLGVSAAMAICDNIGVIDEMVILEINSACGENCVIERHHIETALARIRSAYGNDVSRVER